MIAEEIFQRHQSSLKMQPYFAGPSQALPAASLLPRFAALPNHVRIQAPARRSSLIQRGDFQDGLKFLEKVGLPVCQIFENRIIFKELRQESSSKDEIQHILPIGLFYDPILILQIAHLALHLRHLFLSDAG
ncbi:hypothetical protein CBM2586_A10298 [Cupriavidus phytorum]|uniref:Uncharacterized protein n=1 Tax=Cupriavidus taiwanensis TaxID=164546 RepID=A0A975WPH3_9BURK|nr:hypothetical protein CBM2586_A10298 [Cupriavidus taiwanensis]